MPRPLVMVLLAVACSANLFAEEQPPEQSFAADKIVNKAIGKLRANGKENQRENQRVVNEAQMALEDLADNLIKEGNETEAKVVQDQIRTLNADVFPMAFGRNATPRGKPPHQVFVGRWTDSAELVVTIADDGAATKNFRGKQVHGMLRFTERGAEIRWEEGPVWGLVWENRDSLSGYRYVPGDQWTLGIFPLKRLK